jgi:hypothetical protein
MKQQIYLTTPALFRVFKTDSETGAGYLTPVITFNPVVTSAAANTVSRLKTWTHLMNALEAMINALVTDTDFQNITGDLYNCFGAAGLEQLALVPENMVASFVYDEKVLHQFHNARCLDSVYAMWVKEYLTTVGIEGTDLMNTIPVAAQISQDESTNLIQSVGYFKYTDYTSEASSQLQSGDAILNLIGPDNNPTLEKTMEYTRFTNMARVPWPAASYMTLETSMALVVQFFFDDNEKVTVNDVEYPSVRRFSSFIQKSGADLARLAQYATAFKYAPIFYSLDGTSLHVPIFNSDIYTMVTLDQLSQMNLIDLMTLWGCPDANSITKM